MVRGFQWKAKGLNCSPGGKISSGRFFHPENLGMAAFSRYRSALVFDPLSV